MKLIEQKPDGMLILISAEDVAVLTNALNEVCNGIDVPEFQTRVGASLTEVRTLLSAFATLRISN